MHSHADTLFALPALTAARVSGRNAASSTAPVAKHSCLPALCVSLGSPALEHCPSSGNTSVPWVTLALEGGWEVQALSAARGIPRATQALTVPCSGPGKVATGGPGPQLPVFGGLAPTYTLPCFTQGAQEKMSCCQCSSTP